MADATPPPTVGPPLTFEEVRDLVEAASQSIALRLDDAEHGKGRYLVARRDIAVGEVVLQEDPLFHGGSDANQSRRAYESKFVQLVEEGDEEEQENFDEDCMHPRSPLVDCLAGIILAKRDALHEDSPGSSKREAAALQVRKMASLHRASVQTPVPEDCAQELEGVLLPELRALTSQQEVHDFLHAMSSNRFGSVDSKLDVMFAGSMFEHSCLPNCFVASTWNAEVKDKPREYRALRDIKEGEALSIDYLLMPNSCLGAAQRAEKLAGWGFACGCPRCTSLPELSRAFVCPACGVPELCPERPGPGARLVCRACGGQADEAYAARCLAVEAELIRPIEPPAAESAEAEASVSAGNAAEAGADADAEAGAEAGAAAGAPAHPDEHLVGRFHFVHLCTQWHEVNEGPDEEDVLAYVAAVEAVIEGISRLYGQQLHPHMLELYHLMAVIETGNLDAQRVHLEREASVLRRFYPEEAQAQDDEVMWMMQNRGPPGSEPTPNPLFSTFGCYDTQDPDLSAMD